MMNRIDEQNEKKINQLLYDLEVKTRDSAEQSGVVAKLRAKLESCQEIYERLELADKWRLRVTEALDEASSNLENCAGLSFHVANEVAKPLDEQDQLVLKCKHLTRSFEEQQNRVEMIVDAGRVYELWTERRGIIAKELISKEWEDSMTRLSCEMVDNEIALETESYRLAAAELGIDTKKLAMLAKEKKSEALLNLKTYFECPSETQRPQVRRRGSGKVDSKV